MVGLVGGREEAVDVRLVAVVQVAGFQILDGWNKTAKCRRVNSSKMFRAFQANKLVRNLTRLALVYKEKIVDDKSFMTKGIKRWLSARPPGPK